MKSALIASFAIAGSAALSACSGVPPHEGGPGLPPPIENQCRASEYQNLVGQHRSQIPPAPAGASWRVTCSTCPVTMDYRPDRLNIVYDQRTEIVQEVKCG